MARLVMGLLLSGGPVALLSVRAEDAARPLPTAANLDLPNENTAGNASSPSPASETETAEIPYAVPDIPWATGLGQHRAVVHVAEPANAVAAEIPWRRRDRDAHQKNIVIFDAATGQRLTNVARLNINRERGIVAFEPRTVPGDYFVYYMPFAFQGSWGGCETTYQNPENTAGADWLTDNKLDTPGAAANIWLGLPKAKVLRIEARKPFDSFYPMEVVATDAEVKRLLEKNPQAYLLFPEDRRNPIRMFDDLPLKWVRSGPSTQFQGEALRNEFYVFQIGVFASKPVLQNLQIGISALRAAEGQEIPAAASTCFNTQGVDTWGKPFTKTLTVAAGKVQPLWCGIDIPRDQQPGLYIGSATIQADGLEPQTITIKLTVSGQALEDRGDGDLWRQARLRWLNSTAGSDDDTLIQPYTALKVAGTRIACLGREVGLTDGGLPASVSAGQNEVLAAAARLVVETAAGPLTFQAGKPTFTRMSAARVEWETRSTAEAATLTCKGEMEFDGRLRYFVTLKPVAALDLRDLRLELPFRTEAAQYLMGAGVLGGARPKEHLWQWEGPCDSFWLGSPTAGLQCELRGGSYHGPLLNLYHPAPPPTWGNGGKGGVSVKETDGQVLATAFSGPRQLKAGEEITFEFALIVTPVKPLDPAAHFKTRYWHIEPEAPPKSSLPDPTPEALAAGVNVVNVHQATKRNPYINYPFHSNELITAFTTAMHAKGVKVKLYYTLRELSNYTAELWALRSLGDEVIRNGGGGGFAWMREHIVTGYSPAWYSPFPDGSADAAFVNSGESRWYNYYVEGLGWMAKNLGIDGLYLDDVSYDRHILQRMRRIMERERPDCMIDLHSNTGFSIGPANQYLEFMPYVDRTWFGESFNYNDMSPDQWLVQVSGIPFGVMGEMLADGGNPWRGVLFGMTTRLPWTTNGVRCDPRNVWKVWDGFGIADAKMCGFWETNCPVKTGHPEIPATVYLKQGKALIAVASWAKGPTKVKLRIDWKALGLDPAKSRLHASACERFQPAGEFAPDAEIPVEPGRGWMFVLEEKPPASGWKVIPGNGP